MQVETFTLIGPEFIERAHKTVWCNAASVDRQQRPRSRMLHPIWETIEGQPRGWIATARQSFKVHHLEQRPYLSLTYVDDPFKPIYVDCLAEWADDPATKQRIWELFGTAPPPVGYDLTPFYQAVDHPSYGVLQLTPWRIELGDMLGETRVWKP